MERAQRDSEALAANPQQRWGVPQAAELVAELSNSQQGGIRQVLVSGLQHQIVLCHCLLQQITIPVLRSPTWWCFVLGLVDSNKCSLGVPKPGGQPAE